MIVSKVGVGGGWPAWKTKTTRVNGWSLCAEDSKSYAACHPLREHHHQRFCPARMIMAILVRDLGATAQQKIGASRDLKLGVNSIETSSSLRSPRFSGSR